MRALGWDIGGANLKAGLIEVDSGRVKGCQTNVKYLPLWRGGKEGLPEALREVSASLSRGEALDGIGVTMTAELSDVFKSKREGVAYVLRCVQEVSGSIEPLVVDYNGDLGGVGEAFEDHLRYSSANWAAIAKILAKIFRECILIDVGSTTTDIIPILNHEIAAEGHIDTERLATGELVYTGALRSTIPSITHTVPVDGKETDVASERFALSADIHLILGNISSEEYSTETADGRDTSRRNSLSRLARTICADAEMIGEPTLVQMAAYIHDQQIEKIRRGLEKVSNRLRIEAKDRFPIVTTGLGGRFLGREAALKTDFRRFHAFEAIIGSEGSQAAAAVSTALLVAAHQGADVDWPTY